MTDWLGYRARTTPERVGLVAAGTGEEWTYAELDAAAGELAGRLAGLGVRSGDHVGLLVGTRPVAVRLVHAVMRLGAVLVPLDRRLTAGELGDRVRAADLTVLVCDADAEAVADDAAGAVPVVSVDDPAADAVEGLADWSPEAVAPATWERDATLALVFTSGTTGPPKAVRVTMGNVLSSAIASAFRLGVVPGDRWLVALPLCHMGGLAPLYRCTLYGATVVLRREFEPGETADDIGAHDVTGVSLVPTMLKRMLDSRGTLSGSLRFVLLGGAPASEELVRRCRDYSVPVHPTYGMTETASQIATALPEEAFDHPGTVGRPLFWTDLTVVDEEGTALGPGERGELVVSGPTVTPGYYANEAATTSAFGSHGLHTGDVGYVDESGRVYVLNRLDDRIITGGENVDPGEVVEALRAHPAVEAAAVVGLADETWGQRVGALVVPAADDLTEDELEAHARSRLADYKIPRTVAFVDELPRTVSGTVDREAVRERLLGVGREGDGDGDGSADRTAAEEGTAPDDRSATGVGSGTAPDDPNGPADSDGGAAAGASTDPGAAPDLSGPSGAADGVNGADESGGGIDESGVDGTDESGGGTDEDGGGGVDEPDEPDGPGGTGDPGDPDGSAGSAGPDGGAEG